MHFWPRYPQAGSATGGFPDIHSTSVTSVNSCIVQQLYNINPLHVLYCTLTNKILLFLFFSSPTPLIRAHARIRTRGRETQYYICTGFLVRFRSLVNLPAGNKPYPLEASRCRCRDTSV